MVRGMAARAGSPGVKSQALGLALACGAIAACGAPPVEARAVWLAEREDEDGEYALVVYDRGAMTSRALRPTGDEPPVIDENLGGSLPPALIVELDPRGQGALVRSPVGGPESGLGDSSGLLRAGYLDFAAGRTVPLLLPVARTPAEAGAFAAAGGALWWTEGCPAQLRVVPLSPRVALTMREVEGKRGAEPLVAELGGGCGERWAAVSASDAPVLFALETVPLGARAGPQPGGRLIALRYPLPASGYVDAPALERLASGELPQLPLQGATAPQCVGAGPCAFGVVDPEGEAFTLATDDPQCRLWRWSRRTGEGACVAGFDAPDLISVSTLIAAVSPERYVLFHHSAIHLYDWTTGELRSRPLLDRSAANHFLPSQDGRALAVVSLRGPMVRVDADGIELLSIEQRGCQQSMAPVVSPSARFAAYSCGSWIETEEGAQTWVSGFVRVSAAGLEVYEGVPMWPLALDENGNLLMHSWTADYAQTSDLFSRPQQPPRNLYVLSSDGALERVDALEPDPALTFRLGGDVVRWMDARGL